MKIRDKKPGDAAGVYRLNELAFEQPQEADLVAALHANDGVTLSLVAVEGDEIVGHILFSPVVVTSEKETFRAVGLGPMAVRPDRQRRGIGSELVRAGLRRLRDGGHDAVIVLGHPEYYPRFGFRRASEFGIRWAHEAPDEAFMALELRPRGLAGRSGVVSYRPEFDEGS